MAFLGGLPSTVGRLLFGTSSPLSTDAGNRLTLGADNLLAMRSAFELARRQPYQWSDFELSSGPWCMFAGRAVSSGTLTHTTGTADHPGIQTLSSAAGANSGYTIQISATSPIALLIGGGERFDLIFQIHNFTNCIHRFGWLDTNTATDATDGIYLECTSTAAVLATVSNTSRTTSSTIATLSADTWYRLNLSVNAGGTEATATLFLGNGSNSALGTQTNNANLPTGAGRNVTVGVISTYTTGGVQNLSSHDFMGFGATSARELAR